METDHGTNLGCSVRKRVSVVVDMGLALVLRVRILMRLMVVIHGRMAVLVVVGGTPCVPSRSRGAGSGRRERAGAHAPRRGDDAASTSSPPAGAHNVAGSCARPVGTNVPIGRGRGTRGRQAFPRETSEPPRMITPLRAVGPGSSWLVADASGISDSTCSRSRAGDRSP